MSFVDRGYERYFDSIESEYNSIYGIAKEARSKGLDPADSPESQTARDLAERVEKSVGPKDVSERIRELNQVMPREEVAFKIAEEITFGKFGVDGEGAAEQAIRTALSILDEGVTVAPIQGITKIEVKKNSDRTQHLAVYFAGPIRSAGGTEMALILVVTDYVRQLLGLDRYKATREEAKRFVEELRIYEREVARFQYRFPDENLVNAILHLPIEVNGVETDPVEVASFRDLPRIETNRVRGGALRVVNDGLIGRSNKVLRIVEKLGINGWDWLKEIQTQNREEDLNVKRYMFMEDVIAGRPIFSFPSSRGGFRLRYGRARNTGLASLGVHPSTMTILHNFIASGTQLRTEKPGKAGVILPVEFIEPPVVRLKDESVMKIENSEYAGKILKDVESIIFIGDLLVDFGEFVENNIPLLPSGYVEEWWREDLRLALLKGNNDLQEICKRLDINIDRFTSWIENPLQYYPSLQESIEISKMLKIPLHPKYTYFWETLTLDELKVLSNQIQKSEMKSTDSEPPDSIRSEIKIPYQSSMKKILEKLCIPHHVKDSEIKITGEEAQILRVCLHDEIEESSIKDGSVLEVLNMISVVQIKEKGGTYIGARMGRPEKAKKRQMKPPVHCIFPIGIEGGIRRNIVEASKTKRIITVEVTARKCNVCKKECFTSLCPKCKNPTIQESICPLCKKEVSQDQCPTCKASTVHYKRTTIDLDPLLKKISESLKLPIPDLIKGVKGLTSKNKTPESLEKGVLRSTFDLSVFKDGTTRFDATNAVLTHFKPDEIETSIGNLKRLGYEYDENGEILSSNDQLCPLRIQDIVIPKKCADYLIEIGKFIDALLERAYNLTSYYNFGSRNDLIGHLIVGLSPHTSVGVIGRVIGFTDANVCFAHPFWHAAKRRDCDGDEDSITLLLDVLLNFSRSYLPSRIGGMMDAPLILTLKVTPTEVARQAFNISTVNEFPQELFSSTISKTDSKKVGNIVQMVLHRLCSPLQLEQIRYTHPISNINVGNHECEYIKLPSMQDKVKEQLDLAEMIQAVKADDVAKRVISTHFIRDLIGNIKAFSNQKVRCKKCNAKYRRIPLPRKCLKCGGELTLTVYEKSVEKYLKIAGEMVEKYNTGEYHKQRISLVKKEIESLFNLNSRDQQKNLAEYIG